MTSERAPEAAALRRIVILAVVVLLVVGGLAWLLSSVMAWQGGGRPAAIARGLSLPGLGEAGERAPEPPPDLREASEKLAKVTRENWGQAETYAPRGEEVDPATGEATLPFQGFGVSVDSEPEGARVTVGSREIGTSPVVASVDCQPGAEVHVRIEKAPFAPQERTTRCRADRMLQLRIRLGQ